MTEAERIDFLVQHLAGNNASEFARSIGKSKALITKIRKGDQSIRLCIEPILKAHPQVNRQWLETGEGYPGDVSVDQVRSFYMVKMARYESIIDQLTKRLEELERAK